MAHEQKHGASSAGLLWGRPGGQLEGPPGGPQCAQILLSETGGLGRFRVGAVRRFPAAARGPRDSGIRRNRAGTLRISSYFSPHCDAAQPPAEVAVRRASSARSSSARARAPPWCSALRPQCDAVECDEARASDRAQCGSSHRGGFPLRPVRVFPVALRLVRVRRRRVRPGPRERPGALGPVPPRPPPPRTPAGPSATRPTSVVPLAAVVRWIPLGFGALRQVPTGRGVRSTGCPTATFCCTPRVGIVGCRSKSRPSRTRTDLPRLPSPMPYQLSQGC